MKRRRLTPRERQILAYMLLGVTVDEMVRRCGIARNAVLTHRSRITLKLGVSRVALIRKAVARGWLVADGAGGVKVTFSYQEISAPLHKGPPRKEAVDVAA